MDDALTELKRLRGSIDNMDSALIHLLAERFKVTQRVGELKARAGLPAADTVREAQQIARLRALAVDADLDPELAEKFLTFIVAEVVRHHRALGGDICSPGMVRSAHAHHSPSHHSSCRRRRVQ